MKEKCKKLIIFGLVFSVLSSKSNVSLAMENSFNEELLENLNIDKLITERNSNNSTAKIKINGLTDNLNEISEISMPKPKERYGLDFFRAEAMLSGDEDIEDWYHGYLFSDDKKGNLTYVNKKTTSFDLKKLEFIGEGSFVNRNKGGLSTKILRLFYIPSSEAELTYQGKSDVKFTFISTVFTCKIKKLIYVSKIPDEYELAKRICYFLPVQNSLRNFIKKSKTNKDEKVINLLDCLKKVLNEYIERHKNNFLNDEYKNSVNAAKKLLLIINES